jgi:myo-inositol 2-dehydrogenase / D-chiro-inositol 1-dehydrogenase
MSQTTDRRRFLSSAAAGGILLLKPETVFGTPANSAVELGIIGCGGRGNWIGGHFKEYTGARIVALADAFRDRLESTAGKFNVESARLFAGLDGYKRLLELKLDAVAIESPPYFHPEQAAAAVSAGKHVYLAKPVAVDVPGCQTIQNLGEKVNGRLSFLVDFQTRARPVFQEAQQRVLRGEIGAPVMAQVYYHTGRLKPQDATGMTAPQARLRNWTFDKRLSGDVIVEQHIHVLDVANWYLEARPLKAFGTGGRKARTDIGDAWDHFLVTYWYPNDVRVDFSSSQFLKGYHDMCIRFYGTSGTMDSHYGGLVKMTGDNKWDGAEKDDTFTGGAVTNVKNFVESLRAAEYLNNASIGAKSTLTSILGRTAAYREKVVTWDEMMRGGEKIEAGLKI